MEGGLNKINRGSRNEPEHSDRDKNLQEILIAAIDSEKVMDELLNTVPFDRTYSRINNPQRVTDIAEAINAMDDTVCGRFVAKLVGYKRYAETKLTEIEHSKRSERMWSKKYLTGESAKEMMRYRTRSIVAQAIYKAYSQATPLDPNTIGGGLGALFT